MHIRQRYIARVYTLIFTLSVHVHAQEGESPLHRMARLAAASHLPVGIVLGLDRSLCGLANSAAPADESMGRAGLLSVARQYQLTASDSSPLVLSSTRQGSGHLEEALTHPYAKLPVFTGTMGSMGASLDGWLAVYVDHVKGYGMSWASATDAEQISTSPLTNASLEQLANQIVLSGSKGLWIAEEHLPQEGLRTISLRIFSYHDDKYGLEHLQCSPFR